MALRSSNSKKRPVSATASDQVDNSSVAAASGSSVPVVAPPPATASGTRLAKPLSGVVCCVDARNSDGSDASPETIRILEELGASVERGGLRFGLSHMIWSHGNPKFVPAAQLMDIVVVSPLWVEQCREARARVDESEFAVSVGRLGIDYSIASLSPPRRTSQILHKPAAPAPAPAPVPTKVSRTTSVVASPSKKSTATAPAISMEPCVDQTKSLRDPDSPFFSSSQRQLLQGDGEEGEMEDWRTYKIGPLRTRRPKMVRKPIVVQEKKALVHSAFDVSHQNGVKHIIIDSASYEHLKAIENDLAKEMDALKSASSAPVLLPQFRRIPTPDRIPIPPVPLSLAGADDDSSAGKVRPRRFSERLCDFHSDSDENSDTDSKRPVVKKPRTAKTSVKKTVSTPKQSKKSTPGPNTPSEAVAATTTAAATAANNVTPASSTRSGRAIRTPSPIPISTPALEAMKKDGASTIRKSSNAGRSGSEAAIGAVSTSSCASSEPERPWWINTRASALTSHVSSVSTRRSRGSGMKIAFSGFDRHDDSMTLSTIASSIELNYLEAEKSRQPVPSRGYVETERRRRSRSSGSHSNDNGGFGSDGEDDDGDVLSKSPCLLLPSESLDTTHPCSIVVTASDHSERTGRTLRIVAALATNTPVVTEEWLYECLSAGKWIPPSPAVLHPIFGRLPNGQPPAKYDTGSSSSSSSRSSSSSSSSSSSMSKQSMPHKSMRVLKGYYTSCGLLKDMSVYVKTDAVAHSDPPNSTLVKMAYLCGASAISSDRSVADVAIVSATVQRNYIEKISTKPQLNLTPTEFFDAIEQGLTFAELIARAMKNAPHSPPPPPSAVTSSTVITTTATATATATASPTPTTRTGSRSPQRSSAAASSPSPRKRRSTAPHVRHTVPGANSIVNPTADHHMTQSPSSSVRNDVHLLMKLAAPLDMRELAAEMMQQQHGAVTPQSRCRRSKEAIEVAPPGSSKDWIQFNITNAISNISRVVSPWSLMNGAAPSSPVAVAAAAYVTSPAKAGHQESRSPVRNVAGLFQRSGPDSPAPTDRIPSRAPPLHPTAAAGVASLGKSTPSSSSSSSSSSAFQPSSVVVRLVPRGEANGSQDSPAW